MRNPAPYPVLRRITELNSGLHENLRVALQRATLAPSAHNTQPWLFHIEGAEISLYADPTRRVAVVDPSDRELMISCGAALFHLLVALRHQGCSVQEQLLPEAGTPDLLAVVRVTSQGTDTRSAEDEALFGAIPHRHSNRVPFEEREVPAGTLAQLQASAREQGAELTLVRGRAVREAIAELVAAGDRTKWGDKRFREELADWLIPNRGPRRDGLPGHAFGIGDALSLILPHCVRHLDLGRLIARKDRALALSCPVLAVLSTAEDSPAAWISAGRAMASVLLHATAAGVSSSFLSQPIEVAELRPRLRAIAGGEEAPQLLLRLGYGPEVRRPSPRRPLDQVVVSWRTGPC
jgi:nitroreductase